jgi:guanylate kinase
MQRLLITVTGPSGTGKDAVIGQLLGQMPSLKRYTTATTRAPRPGEVNGQHYHFLSREEFMARLERGEFLEHNANYHGNLYGTLRADVEAIWAQNCDGISDINIHGVRAFRESIPAAHFAVLLLPPSRDRLEARLTKRNPLMAEQGRARLVAMEPDFPHLHDPHYVFTNPDMVGSRLTDYDAVLVNDDLEVTTYAVAERILAERVARGIV